LRDAFEIVRANGLQDFQFFVADGGGVKCCRRFNGSERSQLQNVALNHVAQRASSFVKSATAFHAERFAGGDLHLVNVIAIPERFENSVAEAKDQQVLNGVFAEIVVNAIDLALFEYALNHLVELFRGGKIAAERFFDNDTHPGIFVGGPGQAGFAELLDNLGIHFGRRGKIEEAVAAEILLLSSSSRRLQSAS